MVRGTLSIIEITILSILILATRCANYQDVFVAGNIYFTDADCYARMTRVQDVLGTSGVDRTASRFRKLPGRDHAAHDCATRLSNSRAVDAAEAIHRASLDLAGALISPLLALLGGWFLWWWSVKFRYRWVTLIVYAISPILVHGTELGRPDHQSLLMLLVTVAICAEWSLQAESSPSHRRQSAEMEHHQWNRVGIGDLDFGL